MSDKTVKVRLLGSRPGMFFNDGAGHEIWDVVRGQEVSLPESIALRYRANSIATADLKTPTEELPPEGEVTQESLALADWAREETLRNIPAEIRHRVAGTEEYVPEQPVRGYRRSAKALQGGWIA
jgi:hypothetical protein